jgi:hypothetical protein
MSRRWLLSLMCLFLTVLFALRLSTASGEISVSETQTRLLFQDQQLAILLAVDNPSTTALRRRIEVEIFDPQNRIRAKAEQTQLIPRGSSSIRLLLPFDAAKLPSKDRSQFLWYRLHYRITTDATSNNPIVDAKVSLSEITPDLFDVRVEAPQLAREGMQYLARAQAIHPITKKPAAGVRIDAVLTLETDDDGNGVKRRASGTTDATGFVLLRFDLPARFPEFPHQLRPSGGSLKLTARRGDLVAEVENDVVVDQFPRILISTDKPLYQPGQRLHLRALVFSPTNHALSNQNIIFRVSDPEETDLFRESTKTSRFGIASVDWPIPDNARLGDYQIRVALGDGNDSSQSYARVRISRYDLPNFSVKTHSDRTYYVPGQDADVKVSADYLFGQHVSRGSVRVVRETERSWNYALQKWETEEADVYKGEADASGIFLAHINLAKDHDELKQSDYRLFKDITYAAYFTDPTTNRTEQRRFELRVTKEPIHVYVIKTDDANPQSGKLPLRFYISTYYADGTPAQCRVIVSQRRKSTIRTALIEPAEQLLATVKTNRYGLARVDGLRRSDNEYEGEIELQVAADDLHGKTGTNSEDFGFAADTDEVRVSTDKLIYSPGDPITILVTSSRPELNAVVDVAHDNNILSSQTVQLHDGRASLTIPYKPEFKDQIAIAAYQDFAESQSMISTRTVLFPVDRELKVEAQPTAVSYRPGAEAQVNLRVRGAGEHPEASALGLVVVDKAVEERFRSDRGYGLGFYGSMQSILGNDDEVAGLTLKDIQRSFLARQMTGDLELVAEVLLNQHRNYYPIFFGNDSYEKDQQKVFGDSVRQQIAEMKAALVTRYLKTGEYPNSAETLQRELAVLGIDFDKLRDPWGNPFRAVFSIERENEVLSLSTAGPDKRFGSADDLTIEASRWLYFRPIGVVIDNAVRQYHAQTGGFIRDLATLRSELGKAGFDLDSLRDRWGQPYSIDFDVAQTNYLINVRSSGPDTKFFTAQIYSGDDFRIWTSAIDYFAEQRTRVDTELNSQLKQTKQFPREEVALKQTLRNTNFELGATNDPWGHPFYSTFSEQSFYADRMTITTQASLAGPSKEQAEIKPVTQRVVIIRLRSVGPDGKHGTYDDFDAATFTGIIAEQADSDGRPRPVATTFGFSGDTGGILGIVKDASDAGVSGAAITAKNAVTNKLFETKTDDEGKYLLRNLPPGIYEARVAVPGFKVSIVSNVAVSSATITEVNITLEVGTVSQTVTVTADAPKLQTTSVNSQEITNLPINGTRFSNFALLRAKNNSGTRSITNSSDTQLSTPRLREYFPETLLWQPSIETDKLGNARINFKLADNITTWKMSVIGSTENGEIGTAEAEIKVFQPFFVELDPPRVLTEGDQISLPAVVRNYLERAQTVDLEIKPETWFTLLGSTHKHTEVAAGDAVRETFDLRAIASIKDGKQRITATAAEDSDAIEKPVTVHPDGEEQFARASDIITDSANLNLAIPETAIPGSVQAELKVYPNLMAHVIESIEAIMERPYGCGEQTISSTYPSLLMVRHFKQTGEESPLRVRAQRYLQDGYDRLLNYRDGSGGFTYWGRGEPDIALTAYALRFLNEARDLITVDEDVIESARSWLIKRQSADGSFPPHDYYARTPDKNRTALLTAYVARVLAITQSGRKVSGKPNAGSQKPVDSSAELKRALDFLAQRTDEIAEPYMLASYALAAYGAGDPARAAAAMQKLRGLVHHEGDASYWSLETNTPFYGWGLAGRVETTALVIQALSRNNAQADISTENPSLTPQNPASQKTSRDQTPPTSASLASQTTDPLVRSGLLFLLKQKDRYGVWYSTQTTINVLDTMWTLLATKSPAIEDAITNRTAQILVNGQAVQTIQFPLSNHLSAPINVNIGRFVKAGSNRIEIHRAGGSPFASTQAVANYYVPWSNPGATKNAHVADSDADALRLSATFDRLEGKINDEITCHVKAERVGFHGYGMMLAEIGLPPGADVDRASLETAMKASDWAISQYDVLPDRVVLYLWPRAGGVDFTFKFRGRFALAAKTAPSLIYDYYNPDARAVVAPVLFTIR